MADILLRDIEPAELSRMIADAVADELRKVMAEKSGPLFVDRLRMAELAGIGTATLDNLVTAGKIPSVTIGRRRLFEPSKVIEALSQ